MWGDILALLDPAQQLLPLLDLDEALEEGARVLGHLGVRVREIWRRYGGERGDIEI